MKRIIDTIACASLLLSAAALPGQAGGLQGVGQDLERRLQESLTELATVREQIAAVKVPMASLLDDLEAELAVARQQLQDAERLAEGRALELGRLRQTIRVRNDEAGWLTNLLNEYVQEFETRVHSADRQRLRPVLGEARALGADLNAAFPQRLAAQTALVTAALQRLDEAFGGHTFPGSAVDPQGIVRAGSFTAVGPVVVFRATDTGEAGLIEPGTVTEPTVTRLPRPGDAVAAARVVENGAGGLPVDPTLGNALKIAGTQETLWQHIQKGGPVMIPIFVLAGAALLVALWKWLQLLRVRRPSRRQVEAVLGAIGSGDREAARASALRVVGPAGEMLAAGVEHADEPRELIEEVMYEQVLRSRLRLQRGLPFVGIAAAAAPLLGLLGTVTGIMNTFQLITAFGSGDAQTLSGGISEALITTEYGLIVAIPALLLHAFLSRKARGIVAGMEAVAVEFANQVETARARRRGRAPVMAAGPAAAAPDPVLVRAQVDDLLREMLGPLLEGSAPGAGR